MKPLSKCLLLPIDGTKEALKPVDFIKRLYPTLDHIDIILCYILPPIPPIYRGKPDSEAMLKKKTEILRSREIETRAVMDQAKRTLCMAGFSEERLYEHIQEKEVSLSQHACLLAGVRKADAVVVRKKASSILEGLLMEDPNQVLLHHCYLIPVWLTEGIIDPSCAAICVQNEDTSIRAADHAAFMLAETNTRIIILHATRSIVRAVSGPAFDPRPDLLAWLKTDAGRDVAPFLENAREIVKNAGIGEERIQMTLIPSRGNVAQEILGYCEEQAIGIVVIGHSNPSGKWAFLKTSVTKKALADFRNMAVWVNQ